MDNDLRILLGATLNEGSSVGDINKAIKNIQKHPSLKAIDLKINIDKQLTNALKNFTNNLNEISKSISNLSNTEKNLSKSTENITNELSKETQVLKAQNKELEKNQTLKKKVTTGDDFVRTQTTTGDGYYKKITTTETRGNRTIDHPTVEIYDYEKEKKDAEKLANQIADGRIKAQERFEKQQESQRKKEIDDAHREAKEINDLANQMAEYRIQSQKRVRDFDRQWNENQEAWIQKNAILQRTEDAKTQKGRENYQNWWLKALSDRDQKERKSQDEIQRQHALALIQNERRDRDYYRKIQGMLDKIEVTRSKYGHHKGVNDVLDNAIVDVNNIKNIGDYNSKLKDVNTTISKTTSGLKAARNESISLSEAFSTAMVKFPIWMAASTAFFLPLRGLQDMTATIVEIDSQMTQLKRVMDEETDFDDMLQNSINLSKELGRSIIEVNEALIGFARQGYDGQESLALARTSTLAQNISELTAEESVDALTAAMTAYNIEAGKSIEIIDRLNEVDNNYAVTTQNLAVSMQKASSTASAFGVNLDELIGLSTAIMTATRESGSVVGNSLKTILSRLTTMGEAEAALNSVGVSIRTTTGDVREATDILSDLAGVWNTLSDTQRQNTAVTVAGRYQLNRFLAMMANWDLAMEATETSINSQGSALTENEKYMESLQARIERMKTGWQELSIAFGNSFITDSLIGLISVATNLTTAFANITNSIGALPALFAVAGVAVTMFSSTFRTAIISSTTYTGAFRASIVGLTSAVRGLSIAFKAALASTGVGLAFAGIGFIVEQLISKFADANREIEDMSNASDKLNASLSDLNRIRELSTEYENLSKVITKSIEDKVKLSNIENELKDKFGITITSLEENSSAYNENNRLIRQRVALLQEEIRTEREKASLEYRSNQSSIESEINYTRKDAEDAKNELEELQNKLEQFISLRDSGKTISNVGEKFLPRDIFPYVQDFDPNNKADESYIKLMGQNLAKAVKEAQENWESASTEYQKAINKKVIPLRAEFESYIDTIESQGTQINEKTRLLFDTLANIAAEKNLDFNTTQLNEIFNTFQSSNIQNINDAVNAFNKLSVPIELSGDELKELDTTLRNLEFKKVSDETGEVAEVTEDYSKQIREATSELKEINQIIHDVSNGQSLNADEVYELIQVYPTLKDHIIQTADGYKIEIEALKEVRQEKINKAIEDVKREKESAAATVAATQARISAYTSELVALKTLQAIRTQNDAKMRSLLPEPLYMSPGLEEAYQQKKEQEQNEIASLEKRIKDEQASLSGDIELLNKLQAELNQKMSLLSDPNFGVSSSSKSSNKSKSQSERDIIDATEARINAINQEAKSRAEINNLTEERAKALETEQKYSESIEKTSILLASQKLELESLVKANKQLEQEKINLEKSSGKKMTGWLDENGEQTKAYIDLYNKSSEAAQKSLSTQFSQWQALTKAQIENRKTIESVKTAMADNKTFLDETKLKNTQQYLDKLSKDYEHLNYEISYSKDVQSLLAEGTAEHNSETEKQIQLYRDLMKQYEEDNIWITRRLIANESAIESEKLTQEQIELLNQTLKNNKSAWFEAARAIKASEKELADYREQMADEILDNYKEMLEKRRDLELDAIDASIDAEDKRHEAVMDNLDKELDAFEEIINARLKAMDRANEEEDYQSNLDKLLKERTEIQNKYNTLLKDNSFEAKARRAELAEQIAAKDEEIAELQKERGREIAKQGLEDQLSDREDYIESQKDLEDQAYNATKQKLENEKKLREEYWNSLIEDEQAFYELKENLLSNDTNTVIAAIDSIKAKYGEFFSYLSSQSASLGDMYKTINSNFQIDYSKLDNFIPTNGLSDVQSTNPSSSGLSQSDQSVANQMKINSEKWHTDKANRSYYESENQRLGKSIGAEFDPKTGAWFKNGIRLYHEGGEVGVNGTSTEKWWNRILNLKSNESLGILRNDEVVLDKPLNFVNDVAQRAISGLSNLISNFGTNRDSSSGSSGNTIIERLQVSITGTFNQEDGDDVWEAFTEGLYKKGIRL